jgi:aryl-alcohol dehydrogenase-like predicted oxidoreductase
MEKAMLSLSALSKIGFGCHLVSVDSPQHYKALVHALRSGCNLFDTSANYMHGESEILIGNVLENNPQYDSFVITKSGYDEREELDVTLTRDLLQPEFLRTRVELSLSRLRKRPIDAFLLHSPEAYLSPSDTALSTQDFYARLKKAFEFLEEQVSRGSIRYYGISSNTFHLTTENPDTINLHQVLKIAEGVLSPNHFRLIEFPFNLIEADALKQHHGAFSLIELAHSNNLVTIANRPLNANSLDGSVRLAVPDDYKQVLEYNDDGGIFNDCVTRIERQLRRLSNSEDPMDFAILQYLKSNWTAIAGPDAVGQLFEEYLHPLLNRIYEGCIAPDDLVVYRTFYDKALAHSRKVMIQRTIAFQNRMIEAGVIKKDDGRPLPLKACEIYLNSGIDHVLVGMRKSEYVDMLKSLF